MIAQPRVVVVGAGVAGLSTAYYAARLGAKSVHIVEMNGLASASSGLSAGIFNRQTFDPIDLVLRIASGEAFLELESRTTFRVDRCGYMRIARTEEQWQKVVSTLESGDYPDTRLLDREDIAGMVPGMRVDDIIGGMYGKQDGHMDGPELCAAFLGVARELGVTYSPRTQVLGSTVSHSGVTLQTTNGTLTADVVVNATGAWLDRVGAVLDAPVTIDNQRHEIAMLDVPSVAQHRIPTVQTYFPGAGEDAVYIRPEGPGRFITGLHSYESTGISADPDEASRTVSETTLEQIAEALMERFPGWEDAGLRSGWSGIYPLSPTGRFIIGPHPRNPRVVTVGGLGGVGLTVSPAVGKIAAEWAVLGESTSFPFAHEFLPHEPEKVEVDE